MKTQKTILVVAIISFTFALTGCGGRGGGATAPAQTPAQLAQLQAEGAALTPAAVAAATIAEVAKFDPAKIEAMSIASIQAIPTGAVSLMDAAQLDAMGSVSAFTADQTAALSTAQNRPLVLLTWGSHASRPSQSTLWCLLSLRILWGCKRGFLAVSQSLTTWEELQIRLRRSPAPIYLDISLFLPRPPWI